MSTIVLVSLGARGTLGHGRLVSTISTIAGRGLSGTEVALVTEDPCAAMLFHHDFSTVVGLEPRPLECSRGGHLNAAYQGRDIDDAFARFPSATVVFSTFFSRTVVAAARRHGCRCVLISYPFRSSFWRLFVLDGSASLFDDIVFLDDLVSPDAYAGDVQGLANVHVVPPPIYGLAESIPVSARAGAARIGHVLVSGGGATLQGSDELLEAATAITDSATDSAIPVEVAAGNNGCNLVRSSGRSGIHSGEDLTHFLPTSRLAVCQAGYHTVHELLFYSVPAILIPAVRRIDDQELRAATAAARLGWRLRLPSELPRLTEDIREALASTSWCDHAHAAMAAFVMSKQWRRNGCQAWSALLATLVASHRATQ